MSLSARALAALALAPLLDQRQARSLAATLPELQARCAPRDRALLTEMVQGTARQGIYLQALIAPLLRHSPADARVTALLLLGLYQLAFMRVPAHAALQETVEAARSLGLERSTGLINALLRRYQRESDALHLRAAPWRHSHPVWLAERLRQDWPEQAEAIMAAANDTPRLCLRVNARRCRRDDYLAHLHAAGIAASAVADADDAILLEQAHDVSSLPFWQEGWVSVQDAHAQGILACLDLQPGQRVLDACAAPGGKTAHMLEHFDLDLLALDQDAQRLQRIADNLGRLGLSTPLRQADARQPATWWDGQPFARILLDAPCSGTGVLRRHPDIKFLRRADDIDKIVQVQRELLNALWPLLAPGGRLTYVTCSVLHAENQEQIAAFVAQHSDARCCLEQAWLPDEHDGFYVAALVKADA